MATKVRDYVQSGNTTLSVNLPGLDLPARPGGVQRLVHVHRNVPGVLADIDRILADHQINIEGQLLETRGEIGYVVCDLGTPISEPALAELRAMATAISVRVLDR